MQTKTGIIYLQKDKFQTYSPYLSNVLEFNFVPELIRNFDIVNKELFENLLKAFFMNNKIPTGGFIIVIADNASFIKDFTSSPSVVPAPSQSNQVTPTSVAPNLEDLQAQANEFIEHVPFEDVAGKTYPLPNGVRAFATNQEMFEVIKTTLEKQGFIISVVVPSFAFGTEVSSVNALNINIINLILQKINLVKEYNLLLNPKSALESFITSDTGKKEEPSSDTSVQGKSSSNKPVVLIAVISIILVIILGTIGILIWQFSTPPYTPPPTPVVQAPPPTVAAPTAAPVTVAIDAKDLNVQIINSSSSASLASSVRAALLSYGFKDISIKAQDSLQAAQNSIIFSSRVNADTKNSITADVKKVLGDVFVQDKSDATVDVSIILTN